MWLLVNTSSSLFDAHSTLNIYIVLCRFSVTLSASPLPYQLWFQHRTLILGTLFGLLLVFLGHSAFSAAASLVFCLFREGSLYFCCFNFIFLKDAPKLSCKRSNRQLCEGLCCNEVPLNRSWFFQSLHHFVFIYTRGENKLARNPDPSRQLLQTDLPTVYFNWCVVDRAS